MKLVPRFRYWDSRPGGCDKPHITQSTQKLQRQRQQLITDFTDLERRNGPDTANCKRFGTATAKPTECPPVIAAIFARQVLTKHFAVAANPCRFAVQDP
jgi:hypothetical protein